MGAETYKAQRAERKRERERAEAIDPRWRAMRTAPRDGKTVEVLHETGRHSFWKFFEDSGPNTSMIAWRESHSDWQEESG